MGLSQGMTEGWFQMKRMLVVLFASVVVFGFAAAAANATTYTDPKGYFHFTMDMVVHTKGYNNLCNINPFRIQVHQLKTGADISQITWKAGGIGFPGTVPTPKSTALTNSQIPMDTWINWNPFPSTWLRLTGPSFNWGQSLTVYENNRAHGGTSSWQFDMNESLPGPVGK